MARIRTIKPEFPQSESMGRVSREARLCFILLWTVADDAGRLRGNSRMLASLLFPYDDDAKKHIEGWLGELSSEGCIARYEVDGASYIQICKWGEHQKIDKPSASKLPEFVADSRSLAKPRESSAMDMDLGKDQDLGKEKEGKGSAAPQSAATHVALLPLVDGSEHGVEQASVDEWVRAYPAVDVAQQLLAMRTWLMANKANRKTARGIEAFIVRWLARSQDKAPPAGQAGRSVPPQNKQEALEARNRSVADKWAEEMGFQHASV